MSLLIIWNRSGHDILPCLKGNMSPCYSMLWCYSVGFSTRCFWYLRSSITYEKTQTVRVSWNQYLFIQEFTCLFLMVIFSKESLNKGNQCFYASQSCTIWFTGHPSNKDIRNNINNFCKTTDTKIHVFNDTLIGSKKDWVIMACCIEHLFIIDSIYVNEYKIV